jgi:anti-repressor protein
MTELIPLTIHDGFETVNARDLHYFLESKQDFSTWIKGRIEKYDFKEDVDFALFHNSVEQVSGTKYRIDYHITIDMAKELSMVENNEKGKEARRYFIEVEKRARQISTKQLTDDEMIRNAMMILDGRVKKLEAKIEQDKDKVQFFHDVTGSKDAIEMSKVAKVIDCGMGRNQLFQFLRDKKILQKDNTPYQKYVDARLFRVVEQKYRKPSGETCISIKTLVYQKGINVILKLLRDK